MKRYGLFVALAAAALLIVVAVSGCGRGAVAEINGHKISRADFNDYMQSRAGAQLLGQMLEEQLIIDLAKEKKVPPTNEQINQQIKVLEPTPQYDQMLESGVTVEMLKDQLQVQQAYANLAIQMAGDDITEEEIKSTYEMQKAMRFDLPERMNVLMIPFQSKDAADKAAAMLAKGEKFEEVAKKSGSYAYPQPIPKSGPGVPPEIAKAAFDTPIGKFSDPIKLSGGSPDQQQENWVILKAEKKLPAAKVSYNDAKPIIKGQLAVQKLQSSGELQKMIDAARKKAKVKVTDPTLKQAQKDFENR